jgi:hypothetical protein
MDVNHQQIELRAYHYWQERGQPWGDPETDWFQAEKELTLDAEGVLSKMAREVGSALGTVVGYLNEVVSVQHGPSEAQAYPRSARTSADS